MRKIFIITLLTLQSVSAMAVCTGLGKIEVLWPRSDGWVHVKMEGLQNMDIMNCGQGGDKGMLLNFNDSHGTIQGKQMLYSTLLAAFMSGRQLQLCATACDSQHSAYSRLHAIDNLQ